MRRLAPDSLHELPADVALPAYDRSTVRSGVVHLGIGAFHRAHQAPIFDAALAAGDPRWGIIGASLRSAAVRDDLEPQDGLYTVVVRDGAAERVQLIGAVRDVVVAPNDPEALVAAMARPDVHIVTLTVTEKGYGLDPATGALLSSVPGIAADLVSLQQPQTAPGFIAAALARRRAAGLPPFTAISCDNLPENGQRLAAAVIAIAAQHDPSLARWIEDHGAFPQTAVDRIVPATDPIDIAALSRCLGLEDRATVKTEPFWQWVIEDRFCGPRPDFMALGVHLTSKVAPWEMAKLRLLNGAHSAIAYLGYLAGIEFVHQFVGFDEGRAYVDALWNEAGETFTPPPMLDIAGYRNALMTRFGNTALHHRTRQIAADGSQKLPQRLLAPIAWRLERNLPVDALSLGVAAWLHYQAGRTDRGASFTIDDPMALTLRNALKETRTASDFVGALLTIEAIFPVELARNPSFRAALEHWVGELRDFGARGTLQRYARSH